MMELADAQRIMGDSIIGPDELCGVAEIDFDIPASIPTIPFSETVLQSKREDYYLILGVGTFDNYKPITIRNMISVFGKNPEIKEPCFYNQDWYENEGFIDKQISEGWFMIRKAVYEKSRAVQPQELIAEYTFPSAINCCYAFFTAWLCRNTKLWYHDFVWCSDTDHNGDRVYVGKYHDVDGINRNGFSIHRHLALRDCYGCIDLDNQ